MPANEAKKKYDLQYAKDKLKRIPLDVKKEKYEEIKAAAEAAGEPVNSYIKKAIDERMEREKDSPTAKQPIIYNVPEPEPAATPKAKPGKHYKPFTEADAAKINLQKLWTSVHYQLDISQTYGTDVLTKLLEKARHQFDDLKE